MTRLRLRGWVLSLVVLVACGGTAPAVRPAAAAVTATRDGAHDFDWELGAWKTHVRRLEQPLSGSSSWVEYDGTSVVTPLLGGRENIVELAVEGPAGRIEGVSLRLYDPDTRTWSLNFASAAGGGMTPPVTGAFADERGEFFGDDSLRGRPIRVRFVITRIDGDTYRFEQAFSPDGGQTWEVNWIATDVREPG